MCRMCNEDAELKGMYLEYSLPTQESIRKTFDRIKALFDANGYALVSEVNTLVGIQSASDDYMKGWLSLEGFKKEYRDHPVRNIDFVLVCPVPTLLVIPPYSIKKETTMRTYDVLYNDTQERYSVIFKDPEDKTWSVYLLDAGDHAKEIADSLNASQK